MNNYEFHYPRNLKSKPVIFVWEIKDISVIIIGSMISFYFLLSKGFVFPSVFSVVYALMTTRVNEYTILNGILNCLNFFLIDNQDYDWDFHSIPVEKKQKKQKKIKKQIIKKTSNIDLAIRKKKRENIIKLGFAFLILLFTVLTGAWYYYQEKRSNAKNELIQGLYITFANTDSIEYGMDPVNTISFISDSNGDVSCDPETILPSTIGPVKVDFYISGKTDYGDAVVKKYQKEFQVSDTQIPVIEIESETIVLHAKQKYDIYSNIKSVYDPVDGELEKSTSLEYGTYMVTGEADLNKPGTYPITVDACDRNGKNTTLIYFIEVRE